MKKLLTLGVLVMGVALFAGCMDKPTTEEETVPTPVVEEVPAAPVVEEVMPTVDPTTTGTTEEVAPEVTPTPAQ